MKEKRAVILLLRLLCGIFQPRAILQSKSAANSYKLATGRLLSMEFHAFVTETMETRYSVVRGNIAGLGSDVTCTCVCTYTKLRGYKLQRRRAVLIQILQDRTFRT